MTQAMRARGENMVLKLLCGSLVGIVCASARDPENALGLLLEAIEDDVSAMIGKFSEVGGEEVAEGVKDFMESIRNNSSDVFGSIKSVDGPF